MNEPARYYWDQLEAASNLFQESRDNTARVKYLDYVREICCELINDPCCPRLVQSEARVSVLLDMSSTVKRGSKLTSPENPLQMPPKDILVREARTRRVHWSHC
jgi:hypothetical protein